MSGAQAIVLQDRDQDHPRASRLSERAHDDFPHRRRSRQRRHPRRDRAGDHRHLQHRREYHLGRRTRAGLDPGPLQAALPPGRRGAEGEFRDTVQEPSAGSARKDDRDRGIREDRLPHRPGVPYGVRDEGPGVRSAFERRAEGAISGLGDVHRPAGALRAVPTSFRSTRR